MRNTSSIEATLARRGTNALGVSDARKQLDKFRQAVRREEWTAPTSGVALGFIQANLVVVPATDAYNFLLFCVRNPTPCPILEVLDEGSPVPVRSAPEADLRTDLPRYRIYERGLVVGEVTNISEHWRDDFVAFLLGCALSADAALLAAGIRLRDTEAGSPGAMYGTNIPCRPAGPFHGNLVVSLRPLTGEDTIRAATITSRLPWAHGAPVHVGDPSLIGIRDIAHTDFGDFLGLESDEVPVFWACGVTPQAVAQASQIPFMITHSPGHMFITSLTEADIER